MTPVSAVLIVKNEEHHIARALGSLTWASEILVIDAFSTDKTLEICSDSKMPWADRVRVLSRAWTGFKDQRNYGLQEAKNDWILVLDADEFCSPELALKIQNLLAENHAPEFKAYQVRRVEYFLGKPILHGMWNPSYQDRFFNRKGVYYVNDVHEYPIFPSPPSRIHEPIHHWPNLGPEKLIQKMNEYTTIEARDRIQQGKRTNWFHLIFTFPAMSFKTYFYYGSYKDGMHGLILALLEGVSRLVRHIKMWQIQLEIEHKKP